MPGHAISVGSASTKLSDAPRAPSFWRQEALWRNDPRKRADGIDSKVSTEHLRTTFRTYRGGACSDEFKLMIRPSARNPHSGGSQATIWKKQSKMDNLVGR